MNWRRQLQRGSPLYSTFQPYICSATRPAITLNPGGYLSALHLQRYPPGFRVIAGNSSFDFLPLREHLFVIAHLLTDLFGQVFGDAAFAEVGVPPMLRDGVTHYSGSQIDDLNAPLDRRQAGPEDDLDSSSLLALAIADDLEIGLLTFADNQQRRLLLGQGGDHISLEPLHRRDENFRAARDYGL